MNLLNTVDGFTGLRLYAGDDALTMSSILCGAAKVDLNGLMSFFLLSHDFFSWPLLDFLSVLPRSMKLFPKKHLGVS